MRRFYKKFYRRGPLYYTGRDMIQMARKSLKKALDLAVTAAATMGAEEGSAWNIPFRSWRACPG
jgi:hypothetical protein